MGLGTKLDVLASIIMASTLLVGFWEVGGQVGSVSSMVSQAINDPQKAGLGTMLFLLGVDVWSPVINASYLGPFSFISWFYPFSSGYLPHYSLEACLIALTVSFIATWIFLHLSDYSFWGWGILVAFLSFISSWYVFTVLSWNLMFVGADMIGLSREQAYSIWKVQAEASQNLGLQTLFVANIPLSFQYLVRRYV